jgi:hypothetical protein
MKDITPPESVVPVYLVPPTKKQVEETQKLELEYEQRNQENQAKEEIKLSALDKLAKLGLTEEEAKAIIGV